MVYLSSMIEEGFQIKDSLPEGSKAKSAIWEDFENFQARAANMSEVTQAYTDAANMGDFDPREFGSKACGTCHRDFKYKD